MRNNLTRVTLEMECADLPEMTERLISQKIMLYDIVYKDPLSATLSASFYKIWKIKKIVESHGGKLKVLSYSTVHALKKSCKGRGLIIFASLALLFFTIWIPQHILFFEVSGNKAISEYEIQEVLWNHGMTFGSKRKNLNSETLKNMLLDEIPSLDWAGITTEGCVAKIYVKEKNAVPKINEERQISSIMAGCDGIIESVVVTKGTALCKPGQVVTKGQMLISGFLDCGMVIQATDASGEIFARTLHWKSAISLKSDSFRCDIIRKESNYGLQIGKKYINFKNSSGISHTRCVKMYERKCLTLPGGFQLPIWFHKEEILWYDSEPRDEVPDAQYWMEHGMEQYLISSMTAGSILQKNYDFKTLGNHFLLRGVFVCREEIGKRKIEEIINQNGKHD